MAWRSGTGSRLLALALATAALTACTSTPPSPSAASRTVPSSSLGSGAASGATPPSAPSAPGASAGTPTFFSPTDPSSFSMTGRIDVAPALQDPFSNLLMRGALHGRPVTLDVVGTPDYPVQPGVPGTVLFGTCKCTLRGQGLHLTVEDGSTLVAADAGDIRLRGTFRPVQTGIDAFLLQRP